MKADQLGRRLRFAPPAARVKRLILSEADYLVLEALDRHGPLPTHYLYKFQRHLRTNYGDFQKRLTEFYNGDAQGSLLSRPRQQFASVGARYQHVVYDLNHRARRLLAERDTLARFSPTRADPFIHQLMNACVAASIELQARARGIRYITREEILGSPKCPDATRRSLNPLAIPLTSGVRQVRALIPDDLFGFEYPGVGFRFFAMEVDRGTEGIERRKAGQSSFGRKVDGYLDVLRTRSYRDHWGLPNLTVLTVTTSPRRAAMMLERVARSGDPAYLTRFAVAHEPSFGSMWRVPQSVLSHLVGEPWRTVEGAKDIARR